MTENKNDQGMVKDKNGKMTNRMGRSIFSGERPKLTRTSARRASWEMSSTEQEIIRADMN